LSESGATVVTIRTDLSHSMMAIELVKISLREQAAIFHSHFTRFDVAAVLAAGMLRLLGHRVATIWHVRSVFPLAGGLLRLQMHRVKWRWLSKATSRVITVSESLKEEFVLKGLDETRVSVLSNPVVMRRLQPSQTRSEIRGRLRVPQGSCHLLAFGWDPITKGSDLVIEAVGHLCSRYPLYLTIVGTSRLLAFVSKMFPEGNPKWLQISEPWENVSDLYLSADMFISASRREGHCCAVAEAMVENLPVVCSKIPGLAWAFDSPATEFFESENTDSLVSAVERVLNIAQDLKHMNLNANANFANRRCSLVRWLAEELRIYTEVLST